MKDEKFWGIFFTVLGAIIFTIIILRIAGTR